jgi:multidrug efflux pump subunit AcrB
VIGAGAWLLIRIMPGSFVPSEDQGYLISAADAAGRRHPEAHRRPAS